MSKEISGSMMHCNTAHGMWIELKERFSHTNTVQLFQIESFIHNCEQGLGSVTTFFTKLKALWDEKDSLCAFPTCTSETAAEIKAYLENQKTMKFLMGLNEDYNTIRSNIISIDLLPALNKAYAMALRHEKQAGSISKAGTHTDASAFVVKRFGKGNSIGGQGKSHNNGGENLKCDICSMTNHSTSNCRAHIICSYCEGKGHNVGYCRRRKNDLAAGIQTGNKGQGRNERNHNHGRSENNQNRARINIAASNDNIQNFSLSQNQCSQMIDLLQRIKSGAADPTDNNQMLELLNTTQSSSVNVVGNAPTFEELTGKALALLGDHAKEVWILDSGASDHIICNPALLTSLQPVNNRFVRLPDNTSIQVTHIGTVTFTSDLTLLNVLYVPSFHLNLISISKLNFDSFYATIFLHRICFIQDLRSGKMIGTGSESEGLYCLNTSSKGTCNFVTTTSQELWHMRLGHPSSKVLSSFPFLANKVCNTHNCHICPLAKLTRQPFPLSTTSSDFCFDLIHVDIWGGYPIPSISGAKYFLTIVDDCSRCTWIYLMKHKSEARDLLIHFIHFVETQFDTKVRSVRSDNGPEFKCTQFYASKGILHQTTCINTPQQNGVAERKHRHLLNVARALLFQSHLTKDFWGDAILTAAYLINRTPTPILGGKTPFEKLFSKPPTYTHLRVFGCRSFVSTHPSKPSKLDPRSFKCIFLGYHSGKKGYKLYDMKTKR